MISMDWKDRLIKDTLDFIERKLPQKDYDIDIVYNAYPQRIDNKVPHAVITLVGKTLGSKICKDADKYFGFYEYLLDEKGENGRIIFAYIMARAIKKKPDIFIEYLEKFLFSTKDQKSCNLVIDKSIFPILKKNPKKYLDLLVKWIKKDNSILNQSIQKLLIKLIHFDKNLIEPIFHKLETSWLYATPSMVKLHISFLKAIYPIDPKFYLSVYEHYKSTRNPTFADILCNAICCYDKTIRNMVDLWATSGNIKLKKIGVHGQKTIEKKKGRA